MKIIIMGRTRSGKTELARHLAKHLNKSILKSCTNRPRNYPGEDTYHFYTEEESEKISDKLLLTTGLDGYARWTTKKDLDASGIAILDDKGYPGACQAYHAMGHKVLLIYAMANKESRLKAAVADAKKRHTSPREAERRFHHRDDMESPAFDRMEQVLIPSDEANTNISAADHIQIWNNDYTEDSLDNAILAIRNIVYNEPDMSQVMGYSKFTSKEPIVLEPEDWSEDEWKTLCKLNGMDPESTSRIVMHNTATEVFLEDKPTIYTLDEACRIVQLFDDILDEHDIYVPDEDYERECAEYDDDEDCENETGLHGMTYNNLVDEINAILVRLLQDKENGAVVEPHIHSGEYCAGE